MTNVLPNDGGTLDQDPVFMRDLRTIVHTENSWKKKEKQVQEIQAKIKDTVR
jgi:hypothetical protein